MLSYKKKISIDRTFGTAAGIIIKALTRLLGLILGRDHKLPENPKVIAVAKFVGLGSIVYTSILCRALKKKFPRTKLIYITSRSSAGFVKRLNYIDQILCINDKGIVSMIKSTAFLILRLWRLRPVLYFDMEVYSNWAAIIATLSLALNRYGFYRKNSDLKKGMHTHMIFFNTNRHISQIYSQMALCVGGEADRNLARILNVSDEDKKSCQHILKMMEIDSYPIILVNTNASELLRERRWPEEKWVEYLEQAVKECPEFIFLLTGAPNETEHVLQLYNKLTPKTRDNVFNVSGKFDLGPFLALIERTSLMVTNDSGPFHFAVALGTPTISIWGPGKPEHYGLVSGINKTIYAPVYCSPCLYHADTPPCEGNNICMKDILVEHVLKTTKEIIKNLKESKLHPSLNFPKENIIKSLLSQSKEISFVTTHKRPKSH